MAVQRSVRVQLAVSTASSLLLAYLGNHFGAALNETSFDDVSTVGQKLSDAVPRALDHLATSPLAIDVKGLGVVGSMLLFVVPWCVFLAWLSSSSRGDRLGEQHGSAKWARREDLVLYATAGNPDPDNVLILSKNYGLAVSRKGYDQDHDCNLNVCVIGGSGSGKTRYFVKPNVAQMFGNYFITDPKGTLLPDVGQMLVDNGYEIASFNTNVIERSLVYNPLSYLRTDLEILEFIDGFLSMTTDQSKKGGDPFWDDSTTLFFACCIAYLRDWCPRSDYNFGGLLKLLDMVEVREDNEAYESPFDLLFKEIETGLHRQPTGRAPSVEVRKNRVIEEEEGPAGVEADQGIPSTRVNNTTGMRPGRRRRRLDGTYRRGLDPEEDFALRLYKRFKMGAGKTLKSIIISVSVKLTKIMTEDVRDVVCGDDQLHLERLADPEVKFAFFDTFKDTNQSTLGFLHGLLTWQAVQICCKKADQETGTLERPVQFILDEFKSLNLPKQVGDMISVVRSRNVGMCIIVQSLEQLYELYEQHSANSILGCCSTTLYLGGSDKETNKTISEQIGQMTVEDKTTSVSHQGIFGGSYSVNESRHARALIDEAEVGKLGSKECLVIIKGTDAAKDEKYPLDKHPRYELMDPGHEPQVNKRVLGRPVKTIPARYDKKFDLKRYMDEHPVAPQTAVKGGGRRSHR